MVVLANKVIVHSSSNQPQRLNLFETADNDHGAHMVGIVKKGKRENIIVYILVIIVYWYIMVIMIVIVVMVMDCVGN